MFATPTAENLATFREQSAAGLAHAARLRAMQRARQVASQEEVTSNYDLHELIAQLRNEARAMASSRLTAQASALIYAADLIAENVPPLEYPKTEDLTDQPDQPDLFPENCPLNTSNFHP